MHKTAKFSDCGRYRYSLTRTWDGAPTVAFIMLNPSTADADNDDPTIRRCIGYAKDWGFGGLVVINLFAFRSTEPKVMKSGNVEPIGEWNNTTIKAWINHGSTLVVAAWGNHGTHYDRAAEVCRLVERDQPLYALKITLAGQPAHPLYLKRDLTPTLYRGEGPIDPALPGIKQQARLFS